MLLRAGPPYARRATSIVRGFLWRQHVIDAGQLTRRCVAGYLGDLAARGRGRKTIRNHQCAISAFCGFLEIEPNPCARINVGRTDERLPQWLDDDEIATVLAIARRRGIWPEVRLALATGLRMSELRRLQWPDIDLPRRCLAVRKSKSGRPRIVPLSRDAILALRVQRRRAGTFDHVFPARRTWPGGCCYRHRMRSSISFLRSLRPVQEAVPKFRALPGRSTGRGWHLLRHTFASRLAQAGVSLYKIAEWMGHSDVRTTQIYAHLQQGFDEDIEKAPPVEAAERRRSCAKHC